jgi:hypothetical protein
MITLSDDNKTITVTVPLRIRKPGGRKLIAAPTTSPSIQVVSTPDDALLKALARAHRWKRMLEGSSPP